MTCARMHLGTCIPTHFAACNAHRAAQCICRQKDVLALRVLPLLLQARASTAAASELAWDTGSDADAPMTPETCAKLAALFSCLTEGARQAILSALHGCLFHISRAEWNLRARTFCSNARL